jgi:hypothetical protein
VLSGVAFVTMTLARTDAEADLLVASLERLAAFDRPVFVTDGGSMGGFTDRLCGIRGVRLGTSTFGPGLVGQIRTGMHAAQQAGVPIVCYTEPDKLEFFSTGLAPFLESAGANAPVGLALAAREPAAFGTFPPLQRYAERVINDLVGEVTHVPGDYSYGPFVMDAALAPFVVDLTDDVGWGWRHYLFARAFRRGHRVTLHEGAFACPEAQRTEDRGEQLHRLRQLEQNSRGLLLALARD